MGNLDVQIVWPKIFFLSSKQAEKHSSSDSRNAHGEIGSAECIPGENSV